ncbi:hypothetical protein ACJJTC_008239 [Scirpophaga incertulas]
MIKRFFEVVKILERNLINNFFRFSQNPPKEFALAHIHTVPKFRRTVERRWKRKYGSPEYGLKILTPKTNLKVCQECGHYQEINRLCGNCYKRIEDETNIIKDKIVEKLGGTPIDKEVVVLYNGDNIPDKVKEFWKGKRIIEMKKERPKWFSKNLLQKSTQEPSDCTAVKPTDLA